VSAFQRDNELRIEKCDGLADEEVEAVQQPL